MYIVFMIISIILLSFSCCWFVNNLLLVLAVNVSNWVLKKKGNYAAACCSWSYHIYKNELRNV